MRTVRTCWCGDVRGGLLFSQFLFSIASLTFLLTSEPILAEILSHILSAILFAACDISGAGTGVLAIVFVISADTVSLIFWYSASGITASGRLDTSSMTFIGNRLVCVNALSGLYDELRCSL
jgi:hypothetical protein